MESPLPEPPVPIHNLLAQLGPEKGRACLMSLQGLLLLMRAEYAADGNMLMALAQLEARSLALMEATVPRQRTEVLGKPPV